jgi:predicted enzyme involved in methoxymalonyl-ACP biosynthesis/acyl carrier protein
VREFLPEVVVPDLPEDPSLYLQTLAGLNLFETASFSEADLQRADQYREEARRELTKTQFTNINDYLISLGMEIKLERFNAFNLPRIAQLIQRSNQFNLMTRRYGEAACEAMMKDASFAPFTVKLSDKFGDYGLISVIILKRKGEDVEIDEYLMSCRVLQRGVEGFTMNNIFSYAARLGARRVVGHYIPTKKNDMVKGFFKGFGFEKVADGDGGASQWALAVDAYRPRETFMTPVVNELRGGRGWDMEKTEIVSRLTPIFRDVFDSDALVVSEGMTAKDVPTWDSLSNINMIIAVEKAFGVKFSIKDVRSLKNVGELLELIKRKAA